MMPTYQDDGLSGPWDTAFAGAAGDWVLASPVTEPGNAGGLASLRALETAVILCLFTDKYATPEDGLDPGTDPRGWPGDGFDVRGDLGEAELGSHLWLLRRRVINDETARLAEDYARTALQPLIDQGAFVRFDIEATPLPTDNRIALMIKGYGDDGQNLYDRRFSLLWQREASAPPPPPIIPPKPPVSTPPPFSYDPAAAAFFARLAVGPTTARRALYNQLFLGLRSVGVLDLFDALYIKAAADTQAWTLNLIQDAYNLVPVNNPIFTVDRGVAGNGSNAYVNTGFQPASLLTAKFTQNSGHIAAYNRTARGAGPQQTMGASDGSQGMIQLASTQGAGQSLFRINDGGAGIANAVGNQGLWHADRASSSAVQLYRNGELLASNTVASAPLINLPIWIGAVNVNGAPVSPSTDQIAMASIGASLGSKAAAFYAVIQAFMTGVGANV